MATCVICLEIITNKAVGIPCGHEYCKKCILEWNRQNDTCPICRRNVINVQIVPSVLSINEHCVNTNLRHSQNLNSAYRHQYQHHSRMSNDLVITNVILFALIPFFLVYGDMGVRYMYPPMSTGCRYVYESVKNLAYGIAGIFINITHVMNKLNQGFQKVMEGFETFCHAELSLFSSILKLIWELYIVLLRIATVLTDGVQNLVINFFYGIWYGIWDVMKELWEFVTKVPPEVGRILSDACWVVLRMMLYFNINRLVRYLIK